MGDNENQNSEENLSEELQEVPDERNVPTHVQRQRKMVTYASPIPLPQMLRGYKEVDSTFPERIMSDFEKKFRTCAQSRSKSLGS